MLCYGVSCCVTLCYVNILSNLLFIISSHLICRDEEEFLLSQPVVFRGGQVWWTGHGSAVGDALPPQVCDSTFSTPKRTAWGKVRRKRRGGVVFVSVGSGAYMYILMLFFCHHPTMVWKVAKIVIEPLNIIVHVFKPSCSETSFQHLLRYSKAFFVLDKCIHGKLLNFKAYRKGFWALDF